MTAIVWLRNDLRLEDNPALNAACQTGEVLAVYVREPQSQQTQARDWWLHHSLKDLEQNLTKNGIPLVYLKGDATEILPKFIQEQKATHLFWNRRYDEAGIKTDTQIKDLYKDDGDVLCQSCKGNLLFEPWEIKNKQGGFFKVFTPMFKELMTHKAPAPTPFTPPKAKRERVQSDLNCTLDDFALIDHSKTWHHNFEKVWQIGEAAAQQKLKAFLAEKVLEYKERRDYPSENATSLLSPHLHFGEISPRDIFEQVQAFELAQNEQGNKNIHHFKSEVVWREFSYQQLYFYDAIDHKAINEKFAEFPWSENDAYLKAWQTGQTGIPIVDAGMRELWQTGTLHNRVRMIVASLLTKNMLIPWQEGAKWFMDTLVDADEAANSASWQWVAGCGLDAAPYFRIFNPVTQGERFDENGEYVKKWLPELQDLDKKYIHKPWEASVFDLKLANIELGKTYPKPIVNLKTSREKALEAYNHVKNQ